MAWGAVDAGTEDALKFAAALALASPVDSGRAPAAGTAWRRALWRAATGAVARVW